MLFESNEKVLDTIESYPSNIKNCVLEMRNLIIETAKEMDEIDELIEDLKWNEPSYITEIGSTLRVGWNSSRPDQYGLYFHCQTTLIETFRYVFPDHFTYEGNRAIIFKPGEAIPLDELKLCISLALKYHKVKHLPYLGV